MSSISKKPRLTHRQPADDNLLPTPALNFSGNADFIESCEKNIIRDLDESVASIISNSENPTYASTTGAFSTALARASLYTSQCSFPALVSSDSSARERSSESKKIFRSVFDRVFSNRDLFEKLQTPCLLQTPEQTRINQELCQHFERRGVGLASASDRSRVALLSSKIGELEGAFEQAINEDTTVLELTEEELSGCPESFIASLDLLKNGKRALTMKAPHTVPVAKHCVREDTRRRLQVASQTRCSSNESLLEELVSKRQERAQLLGWKDHASFMLSVKMAETPEHVMSFMESISTRLQEAKDQDMSSLHQISNKERIENWDYSFYARALKEQVHSLDDEAIREYFPLEHVRREILSMYETLLDVEFRKFEDGAPSGWHEDVQGFAVLDATTHDLVGHFYLDLFSRPGKFGHQCVVPLAPSFVEISSEGGGVERRQLPACAILGNMTKPNVATGRPSLLTFSEVKTFFHEFGHGASSKNFFSPLSF
jgi:thimet oligopeptidase